jgi:hypothetical protein
MLSLPIVLIPFPLPTDILLADVQHDPSQLRSHMLTEEGSGLFGLLVQVRLQRGAQRAAGVAALSLSQQKQIRAVEQQQPMKLSGASSADTLPFFSLFPSTFADAAGCQ